MGEGREGEGWEKGGKVRGCMGEGREGEGWGEGERE